MKELRKTRVSATSQPSTRGGGAAGRAPLCASASAPSGVEAAAIGAPRSGQKSERLKPASAPEMPSRSASVRCTGAMRSECITSAMTLLVAVAVSAMMGTLGQRSRHAPSAR